MMLNRKCREIVSDDGKIGLVFGIEDADNKANARLIASAPRMLAVLKMVLQHGRIDNSESKMSEVAAVISAAESSV